MFVCFVFGSSLGKCWCLHMHECLCLVYKDLHQLGFQYCLFVPQSVILLMKIIHFSLLFTTVTQLHHEQGAETIKVSISYMITQILVTVSVVVGLRKHIIKSM